MGTTHTVRSGDCFASLAATYGFSDPRLLYNHPDNAALKKERPELTTLVPGDKVFIPDKEKKEVDAAAGKMHSFKVKLLTVRLELVLKLDEEPLANKAYRLVVAGKTLTGTTGGDGKLSQRVPATAQEGRVELDDPQITWDLAIGSLQPPSTAEGAAARIANLGLTTGPVDVTNLAALGIALRSFQAQAGIDLTGELDDATRDKLKSLHDG